MPSTPLLTHRTSRGGARRLAGAAESGFTLLELIVVIAIIGILATIAMPAMKDMPRRANEAVLKTNLHTLRDVIDQYHGDKGKYPQSLDTLVEAGYLHKVPIDPITKRNDTWVLHQEERSEESGAPQEGEDGPGIDDVHSGAPGTMLDGRSYADL
jgi:general secretion pathway protein G